MKKIKYFSKLCSDVRSHPAKFQHKISLVHE